LVAKEVPSEEGARYAANTEKDHLQRGKGKVDYWLIVRKCSELLKTENIAAYCRAIAARETHMTPVSRTRDPCGVASA
jgi:hypothetical protein